MSTRNWLIYGANGYTAHLLAEEAVRQGLTPILAGRDPAGVQALATRLGLSARIFDLNNPAHVAEQLADIAVVAHCAGPFSATSAPMIEACLTSKTHYVDITGEIGVFQAAEARDAQAREAGIVLLPGSGFDVIPTDCVAACLKDALPDATHLCLGFDTGSGLSPGTAKTSVEGLKLGGQIRRDGQIISVPMAHDGRDIDFGRGLKHAATIPWGDVATAFYSTGIANISVYLPLPAPMAWLLRLLDPLRPLLGKPGVQRWLKAQVSKRIKGPSANARQNLPTWVWGEARNAAGVIRTARLTTGNGYDVTVHGVLLSVRHLLDYQGQGGYFTPSKLLGPRCIEQLPGSTSIVIS